MKTETQSPQVQFGRVPSSGRFRAKDGATHRRTFTARPPEGCSRHVTRADYTHNEARLVDIARETRSLVTRLEHIYGRQVGPSIAANSPPRGKPCNEAPTHRNRYVCMQSDLSFVCYKCSCMHEHDWSCKMRQDVSVASRECQLRL